MSFARSLRNGTYHLCQNRAIKSERFNGRWWNIGWAFILYNGDDFRLTWFTHSRYSLVCWVWIQTCFLLPTRRGLRGHSSKVLHSKSHHRRRGSAVSVRVMKYWGDMLPASVVTAHIVKILKFGQRFFSVPTYDTLLRGHSSPQSANRHPSSFIQSISMCYST